MIGSALPALSLASNVVARRGQISVPASDLFGLVDTDGNPITRYALFDTNGYGHWVINGVAQASNTAIDITAAELSKTSYVFGSAAETLHVRINDGAAWGGWQSFTASPYVNHAPVVTTHPIVAMFDTSLDVSYLFSAVDPDGDAITKYQLWDSTPGSKSGHWVVNGVAQGTGTAIDVTADQLAHTSFHTAITDPELLWACAFDGVAWSDWKSFTITVPADGDYPGPGPNHKPVVTAQDTSALHGQSLAASALFSAQDIDGDAITWYEVWDSTDDASSGSWVLDGVRTQSKVAIEVAADQLANLDFLKRLRRRPSLGPGLRWPGVERLDRVSRHRAAQPEARRDCFQRHRCAWSEFRPGHRSVHRDGCGWRQHYALCVLGHRGQRPLGCSTAP